MKISRHKKVNKYLNFYCNNFGFRKPFQILIDGTFCYAALKNKMNIQEQLPKYLGDVKLLTTPCVIKETELLEKAAFGAMVIVKQFSVHRCQHCEKAVSGSQCFLSMIGNKNASRYVIATQDRDLQDSVRNVPGTPLMYLHQKTPHLEEPSLLTLKVASNAAYNRFGVSELDDKKLAVMKTAAFGQETEPQIVKKRKAKGGPNSLSCKKKKKSTITHPKPDVMAETKTSNRRRKRKKIAKHVKEYLINNSN